MYLEAFGVREEPFGVTPDPRYTYAGASHREAFASLLHGIQSGRGFMALIAEPGMGKTTLLNELLEETHTYAETASLFQTQCTRQELLRYLLSDVGFDPADDVVAMHEQFNQVLLSNYRAGKRFILIIDEAHNLSDETLESVRLLSDFETPRAKLLQIILAGQPQLGHKLSAPHQWQLRQRMSIVCHLRPLSPDEVLEYIETRLRVAGRNDPLFTHDAVEAIALHSRGIPRIINNYCFNAMSLAYALDRQMIGADIIEEVAGDLDLQEKTAAHGWEALRRTEDATPAGAKVNSRVHRKLAPKQTSEPGSWPASDSHSGSYLRGENLANWPTSVVSGAAAPAFSPIPEATVRRRQTHRLAEREKKNGSSLPGPVPVANKSVARQTAPAETPPTAVSEPAERFAELVPPWVGERWSKLKPGVIGILLVGLLLIGVAWYAIASRGDAKPDTVVAPSAANPGSTSTVPEGTQGEVQPTADEEYASVAEPAARPPDTPLPAAQKKAASVEAMDGSTEAAADPQASETNATETGDAASRALFVSNGAISRPAAISSIAEAPPAIGLASDENAPLLESSSQPALPAPGWKQSEARTAVVPGTLVKKVMPAYPPAARGMRLEETVELTAKISEEGIVQDVQVEKGSGLFSQQAIAAVRQWRYTPFTLRGRAVPATTRITINFHP